MSYHLILSLEAFAGLGSRTMRYGAIMWSDLGMNICVRTLILVSYGGLINLVCWGAYFNKYCV